MVSKTRYPEQTLRQPRYSIHKPCTTLNKEHECKNVPDAVESETKTGTRKVIVRSSYFQHKSENQKDPNNKHEKVKADDVVDANENNIPEDAFFSNNDIKDKVMKRKTSSNDCSQKVGALTLFF
jgi:exonuclease-1